jgi:hypothetical protein
VTAAETHERTDFVMMDAGAVQAPDIFQIGFVHCEDQIEIGEVTITDLPGMSFSGDVFSEQGFGHASIRSGSTVMADGSGRIDFKIRGSSGIECLCPKDVFGGGRAANVAKANKQDSVGGARLRLVGINHFKIMRINLNSSPFSSTKW